MPLSAEQSSVSGYLAPRVAPIAPAVAVSPAPASHWSGDSAGAWGARDQSSAGFRGWLRREARAALRVPDVAPLRSRRAHGPGALHRERGRIRDERQSGREARWRIQRRAAIQWLTFPPRQRSQA